MPSNKGTEWETKGALSFRHAYKLYKIKTGSDITLKQYREVITACNVEFSRMLVEEGRVMRMPYLSKVQVMKTQSPSRSQINYDLFNKTGEKRIFTNEHSDGFRPRVHWSKFDIPIVGALPYSLKLTRELTTALSKAMKVIGGHKKYPEFNYGK